MEARLAAFERSQAVIEFKLDGTVVTANENFLSAMGYTLDEIRGRHHAMFVDPDYAKSAEYKAFWEGLARGEYQVAQFRRLAKGGREIWIQASYSPILGSNGKPVGVVKLATDITARVRAEVEKQGQIDAIRKSQAVISFDLDGIILDANENFLQCVGYSLAEIQGRHHGMFVEPAYRDSAEYRDFWARLKRGEFQTGRFKRAGKGGREVWIEASYNPILDASGRPYKIVKFASDITPQMHLLADLRQIIERNFGEIDKALARSTQEADGATRAVGETAGTVRTMAAAAEELAASVGEISTSMASSRATTDDAYEQASAAGESTKRLADAATSMSGIIGLIQNIAGQINLLALNATIESARAGEHGRGFAVVAQEVKNLANQASRAADQIVDEINNIQSISTDVVTALDAIRGSVEAMRGHLIATSSAVEQQSAVTRDMSSNMQNAAYAVGVISQNVTAMAGAVAQVGQAVSTTKEAAKVLAR